MKIKKYTIFHNIFLTVTVHPSTSNLHVEQMLPHCCALVMIALKRRYLLPRNATTYYDNILLINRCRSSLNFVSQTRELRSRNSRGGSRESAEENVGSEGER